MVQIGKSIICRNKVDSWLPGGRGAHSSQMWSLNASMVHKAGQPLPKTSLQLQLHRITAMSLGSSYQRSLVSPWADVHAFAHEFLPQMPAPSLLARQTPLPLLRTNSGFLMFSINMIFSKKGLYTSLWIPSLSYGLLKYLLIVLCWVICILPQAPGCEHLVFLNL